jgi:hypothetical protein
MTGQVPAERWRLSYLQEEVWLRQQMSGNRPLHHVPVILRFTGPVRPDLVGEAARLVIARHRIMRTRIERQGTVLSQVVDPLLPDAIPVRSRTGMAGPAGGVDRAVEELVVAPFRLDREPPWRAAVIVESVDRAVFALVTHHVIWDGRCSQVLISQLLAQYDAMVRGDSVPSPPVPQYAAEAEASRRRVDTALEGVAASMFGELIAAGEQQAARRARSFGGAPQAGFSQGGGTRRAGHTTSAGINRLGRTMRISWSMVLMTTLGLVLETRGVVRPVVIGLTMQNRTAANRDVIGLFVNVVPVVVGARWATTVFDLLREVRDSTLGAARRCDISMARLTYATDRPLGTRPVELDAVLDWREAIISSREAGGCRVERIRNPARATPPAPTCRVSESATDIVVDITAGDLPRGDGLVDDFLYLLDRVTECDESTPIADLLMPLASARRPSS